MLFYFYFPRAATYTFIAYTPVSLFLIRSVYIQSFDYLNNVSVRSTMDFKLEEQRSVIKSCFSIVKNLVIVQRCNNGSNIYL